MDSLNELAAAARKTKPRTVARSDDRRTQLIVVACGVIACIIIIATLRGGGRPPAAPVAASPVMRKLPEGYDPSKRAEREQIIGKMRANRFIGDVYVSNHVGKMVAGPMFYALDYKERALCANVVYAWCLDRDRQCSFVRLLDHKTNKEIGTFSAESGLELE